MPTLREQAHKAAIKAVTPSQFRVGGSWDGVRASGGVTYNRTWSNLWGVTAYAKAYWNDQAVVPTDRWGYAVGAEIVKEFKR